MRAGFLGQVEQMEQRRLVKGSGRQILQCEGAGGEGFGHLRQGKGPRGNNAPARHLREHGRDMGLARSRRSHEGDHPRRPVRVGIQQGQRRRVARSFKEIVAGQAGGRDKLKRELGWRAVALWHRQRRSGTPFGGASDTPSPV